MKLEELTVIKPAPTPGETTLTLPLLMHSTSDAWKNSRNMSLKQFREYAAEKQ